MGLHDTWNCPQCGAPMDTEEECEVREIVEKRGQCEIRCPDCGEELMADINAFGEGKFQLVEMWNYY